jgi:hypothetical protein
VVQGPFPGLGFSVNAGEIKQNDTVTAQLGSDGQTSIRIIMEVIDNQGNPFGPTEIHGYLPGSAPWAVRKCRR